MDKINTIEVEKIENDIVRVIGGLNDEISSD